MNQQEVQFFRAEVIARKDLPTIPIVLTRILTLCDRIDANCRELVSVIEDDQALTAKILRLANSAFFGQSRRVATIPRAVILLGLSTVRNLTLSVKVWDALGKGVARARLEILWTHAVTCAMASKAVAARLRTADPDETFTAALLHDVGRLVLAMRFRDEYWKTTGVAEADPIDVRERDVFGVDHPEVGAWMLEAWALPPTIVEAVRRHHEEPVRLTGAGIVGVTDRLLAGSDLEEGTIGPQAAEILERTSEDGLTRKVWEATLVQLQASGTRTAFRLAG